jgi:hypothetical protein
MKNLSNDTLNTIVSVDHISLYKITPLLYSLYTKLYMEVDNLEINPLRVSNKTLFQRDL